VENQREIRRPEIPWSQTIIYEAHVEGLTKLNLEIPKALRGTYKALSHPLVIKHLKDLGVTTLELLPIQAFVTEPAIAARGRENYWGYNPIAFSAPHHGFAATDNPITELQDAVDALHDAGIEVILDLVYNHTAEGGKDGPLLSMKGIDARGFYHHSEDGSLQDFTGCGNTVKASHPVVASMIIDSLLWWSEVIGVDGFRFDLTTSLSRESRESNRISLIDAISTHPILSRRKLIAEPWDVAGYSLGQFPPPWREWNDRFRDGVRSFWLSSHAEQRSVGVADLARRISGSDDIFAGRGPDASINFITAHDGFTLHDLVTFQVKENSPNGENNRDGSEKNLAWNIGFEGETEDRYINQLRHRLKKSLAGTLLLSAGVPMLVMGDELSRSQNGSNNAFTIDRNRPVEAYENFAGGLPLPWGNYQSEIARDLMESIARLTEIRSKYLNHLISEFFTGGVDTSTQRKDIAWFDINGKELDHNDWHDQSRDHLSIYFSAHRNQGLLVLLNASLEERDFQLPQSEWGDSYRCIFDSSLAIKDFEPQIRGAGEKIDVAPLALHAWLVLIHTEK
jgi:glycogen operon protein